MVGVVVAAVALCAAVFMGVVFRENPLSRWQRHESLGLAPFGGGFAKDTVASLMTAVPRLQRTFKDVPSDESLESFHDNLAYGSGQALERVTASPFFTENFYFWGNIPGDTSFVYTMRLSFYGVNGSHVVPWFHFFLDGEKWTLPAEFEELVPPHKPADGVSATTALGQLHFRCEVPMVRWRLTYVGVLENVKSQARRHVDASFVLHLNPRNVYKYQLNHWDEFAAARAMAGKEWTRSFFTNLRAQNQERYASQADRAEGHISFLASAGGEQVSRRDLPNLDGSRDHNIGIRNWRFIQRYIWWPGVRFLKPLRLNGVDYTYLTGAFTDYGNTMSNMVIGGLMSDAGDCAAWSGATPMVDIAPEWYNAVSEQHKGIGDRTLGSEFSFRIGLLSARYVLDIEILRGSGAGMWQHAFMLNDGKFEIHEAMSTWTFVLRKADAAPDSAPLATASAVGLFEFGANLVTYSDATV